MFHNIPKVIKERMSYLEKLSQKQKKANTPPMQRLRQIPPETGKFLALLAASAPEGTYLEIGTSGGVFCTLDSLSMHETRQKINNI